MDPRFGDNLKDSFIEGGIVAKDGYVLVVLRYGSRAGFVVVCLLFFAKFSGFLASPTILSAFLTLKSVLAIWISLIVQMVVEEPRGVI